MPRSRTCDGDRQALRGCVPRGVDHTDAPRGTSDAEQDLRAHRAPAWIDELHTRLGVKGAGCLQVGPHDLKAVLATIAIERAPADQRKAQARAPERACGP